MLYYPLLSDGAYRFPIKILIKILKISETLSHAGYLTYNYHQEKALHDVS